MPAPDIRSDEAWIARDGLRVVIEVRLIRKGEFRGNYEAVAIMETLPEGEGIGAEGHDVAASSTALEDAFAAAAAGVMTRVSRESAADRLMHIGEPDPADVARESNA